MSPSFNEVSPVISVRNNFCRKRKKNRKESFIENESKIRTFILTLKTLSLMSLIKVLLVLIKKVYYICFFIAIVYLVCCLVAKILN